MSADTAFGVSRYLEAHDRLELVEFLRLAWTAQCGDTPGDLATDLELLQPWFRPDLTGRIARKRFPSLARLSSVPPPRLSAEAFLVLPGGRGLVTPEGRALLSLLENDDDAITDGQLLDAQVQVTRFYGESYRVRLGQLLSGGDVRPNTLAFVVFLLINGSVGGAHAFMVPEDPVQERQLAEAVASVLDAFAEGIGGQPLKERERTRLRGNWALTESAAQLPDLVSHEESGFWILDDAVEEVPERIGTLVARRRDRPSPAEFESALGRMQATYREVRPALAAQQLAHDRPKRTESEFRRMLAAYQMHPVT